MKLYHLPNHDEECQGCLVLELLGALEDIAKGRTLIMDDVGETFGEALQRDAQAAINKVRSLLPEERRESW